MFQNHLAVIPGFTAPSVDGTTAKSPVSKQISHHLINIHNNVVKTQSNVHISLPNGLSASLSLAEEITTSNITEITSTLDGVVSCSNIDEAETSLSITKAGGLPSITKLVASSYLTKPFCSLKVSSTEAGKTYKVVDNVMRNFPAAMTTSNNTEGMSTPNTAIASCTLLPHTTTISCSIAPVSQNISCSIAPASQNTNCSIGPVSRSPEHLCDAKKSLWRPISSLVPPTGCSSPKNADSSLQVQVHFNKSENVVGRKRQEYITAALVTENTKKLSQTEKLLPSSSSSSSNFSPPGKIATNQKTILLSSEVSTISSLAEMPLSLAASASSTTMMSPIQPTFLMSEAAMKPLQCDSNRPLKAASLLGNSNSSNEIVVLKCRSKCSSRIAKRALFHETAGDDNTTKLHDDNDNSETQNKQMRSFKNSRKEDVTPGDEKVQSKFSRSMNKSPACVQSTSKMESYTETSSTTSGNEKKTDHQVFRVCSSNSDNLLQGFHIDNLLVTSASPTKLTKSLNPSPSPSPSPSFLPTVVHLPPPPP